MKTVLYFSGRVHSVIFENEGKAFYILRMVLDAECITAEMGLPSNSVTVRGDIPGIKVSVGTWFGFEGTWDDHPQHGRQVKITRAPVIQNDWGEDTCEKILMSQGVGPSVAAAIRLHFGKDMATALLDPAQVEQVEGMSKFTAQHVVTKWQMARAHFMTLDFLNDLGLPQGRVRQVWGTFGDSAREVLSVNPWALVQIEGITFEDADTVATRLSLDCTHANPYRVEGAVLYASRAGKGFGHLYSSSTDILQHVKAIDRWFSDQDIARALRNLTDRNLLVVDRVTVPGVIAIYDPWSYKIEVESAKALSQRVESARISSETRARYVKTLLGDASDTPLRDAAMDVLRRIGTTGGMNLTAAQTEGVLNAVEEPVSIVTGLPGTGKSTSLRMAVYLLQEAGVNVLIVAPTGIAAKRVTAVTGAPASTIHRAFKAKGSSDEGRESTYAGVVGESEGGPTSDGSDEVWGYGPSNPHPAEVVILDESSMVDQHILYRVLTCTRPDARLVFVGDAAQLPSVGPGNVLRDLIASRNYPTVALTEIFRQAETSPIIRAAHDIHAGRIPEAPMGTDFSLAPMGREEDVASFIVSVATRLFERRQNFQVLSPRHSGPVGVTTLNTRLREILNPKQPSLQEVKLGNEILREEDRIMVVKNDYKLGVFNGDVGKVVTIDKRNKEIEIKIHGPPVLHVRIPFKSAQQLLRLAYAVTVHKCVHPDTIMETHEGLLPIRDVAPRGTLGGVRDDREYHTKVENPVAPARTVTVRGGYQITGTPDHGIDVWDGCRYVRRELGTLQVGDLLRMPMGVGCDVPQPPAVPAGIPEDVREVVHPTPTAMSPDLAEFLGLMVADGTLYSAGFRLAKRHEDVADRFDRLCQTLFGVEPRRYLKSNAHHVEVNSVFLVRWLRAIGGMGPRAKAIPDLILRSPETLQRRFLRGLFEDGTVNVQDRKGQTVVDHLSWSTKYPEMGRTVSIMLLRAGIPCHVKPSGGTHRLYVFGEHALDFGKKIGFVSRFKQDRLANPARPNDGDFIPLAPEEARELRALYRKALGRSRANNAVERLRISRAGLALLRDHGGPLLQILRDRARDHHVPVITLEDGLAPSMCVTVPDGHQFRQGGFAGWNCQGQEYDVILMPLVTSFNHQLQRNLFYTAVTRARKKVVLVGHHEAMVRSINNDREGTRNTLFLHRLTAPAS